MTRMAGIVAAVVLVGAGLLGLWRYWDGLHGGVRYRITEVCSPCASGWALNERGLVVGYLETPAPRGSGGPVRHASVWSPGRGTADLGTLGGPSSRAQDINDRGLVVGMSDIPSRRTSRLSKYQTSDGFAWKPDLGMIRMGRLIGRRDVEGISPVGVNNRDQVVGCASFTGHDGYHAFIWHSDDGITDLGTLGGKYSCAVAANDRGQVIGNADLPGRQGEAASHAFLWDRTGGMVDLGTLGGKNSYARAINEAGQVVGSADTETGALHAFLWSPGKPMRDLGTLGGTTSSAMAINAAGAVVGDSTLKDETEEHAFIWDGGPGLEDLNEAIDPEDPLRHKVFLRTPRGINDRGQILVDGEFFRRGETHSLLLTPLSRK